MAVDPVLIVVVVAVARGITRLAEALSQRMVLRARAELARVAVSRPAGTEVTERDRHGISWSNAAQYAIVNSLVGEDRCLVDRPQELQRVVR